MCGVVILQLRAQTPSLQKSYDSNVCSNISFSPDRAPLPSVWIHLLEPLV